MCIRDRSYTDDTNAVKLASSTAPTFADMVKLAGMLGPDFIDNAQWYVSSSTYFNWLLSLKDDQKRPILEMCIRDRRRPLNRYIITANSTLKTVVNKINKKFMPKVLRTTRQASEEVKKNSKFSNPTQGLSKIPRSTLNFLNARMMPPMGI